MSEDPSHPLVARRAFTGGSVCLVLAGCAGKTEAWEPKSVPVGDDGLVELDLVDYPELVTPGGMVALRPGKAKKPVLVQRIEDHEVRVLSLECTHMGCVVRWDAQEQRLRCPCHGSRFDDRGQVQKGPAKRPLPSYESVLEGTVIKFIYRDGREG